MALSLMTAICVLVALVALPGFTCGRPAIDHSGGSASNALLAHDPKQGDFPDHEQRKATVTTLVHGGESIPVNSRQKRLSDQRLAELETRLNMMLLGAKYRKVDLRICVRRKRATTRSSTSPGTSPIAKRRRRLAN